MALTREQMAQRVARELARWLLRQSRNRYPHLWLSNYVEPEGIDVMLQSENGLLGHGAVSNTRTKLDADMINAGKQTVTARKGAAIFSSADSFAMIRGEHIRS